MGVVNVKVRHYGSDGSESDISDIKSITARKGSKLTNNSMDIILRNKLYGKLADGTLKYSEQDSDGNLVFKTPATMTGVVIHEDKLMVWANVDETNAGLDVSDDSNDLVFVGRIKEVNGGDDSGKRELKLTSTDRTYELLNRTWVGDFPKISNTGTLSGVSGNTLSDSSASWIANEHVGKVVTITSGTGSGKSYLITSNTSTSLTLRSVDTPSPDGVAASDTYQIGWTSPSIQRAVIRQISQKFRFEGYDSDGVKVNDTYDVATGTIYGADARFDFEGAVEFTPSSVTNTTITNSSASWETDAYKDLFCYVLSGTAKGKRYRIISNTATTLTLHSKSIASDDGLTSSDIVMIQGGFIETMRPDGSEYPTISMVKVFKPVFEWISQLTAPDHINSYSELLNNDLVITRSLLFHIDTRDRYHCFRVDDEPTISLDSSDSSTYKTTRVSGGKKLFGTTNMIIYRYKNMNQVDQLGVYYQAGTGAPIVKDSYRPMISISEGMQLEAIKAGQQSGYYKYPSSYPVVPVWDRQQRTANSDSDYNDYFEDEADLRCRAFAQGLIKGRANPLWVLSWEIKGKADISVNSLLEVTHAPLGLKKYLLRVVEVDHSITNKGFFTNLKLKEDQKVMV